MDWFPWYFTLYEQDTMHLDPYQDGCYRRLIDHYMKTRAPLKDNDFALARIVGVSYPDWHEKAAEVVRKFFRVKDGFLIHKRCERELAHQDGLTKKLSESGKKGAEIRNRNKLKNKDNLSPPNSPPNSPPKAYPQGGDQAQDRTGHVQDKIDSTIGLDSLPASPRGATVSAVEVQMAVSIYNETAKRAGLPPAMKISDARSAKLKARLKDAGGLEGWRAAMEIIEKSSFLTGGGEKGWKADLDFILQEKSFTRLMEGYYEERKPKNDRETPTERNVREARELMDSFGED